MHRHPCPPLGGLFGLLLLALAGCSPAGVVGGGAAAGVAAVEERTVGEAIDDSVISTKIDSNLLQKDIDLFRRVGVEVIEGRVLLTGSVPTTDARIEAVRQAWRVAGVKEVINELQVTDKGGIVDYARDSWISAQLRTKLLLDKEIQSVNYSIETVNGIVYLIGIAQDQAELDRVTNHARNIRYVEKVVSYVRLPAASKG